jgi:hypothetical protein
MFGRDAPAPPHQKIDFFSTVLLSHVLPISSAERSVSDRLPVLGIEAFQQSTLAPAGMQDHGMRA